MESTRLSLLTQATAGSQLAWTSLVELYQPLIYGWLRRRDVDHHDAEELTQEVLAVLVKELPSFSHSGRTGAFRHWLRQITANRALGFWRAGKVRREVTSQGSFLSLAQQLEDPASDLSRCWAEEHDQYVLRQLLCRIEGQFELATITAFRRQVFDGVGADAVAVELGMTVGAAYSAKSRVLRKLRQEAEGLVDDALLS